MEHSDLTESQQSLRDGLSALYSVVLTPEQVIQATSTPASNWPPELRQKLNPRLLAWHWSSARTPLNYHDATPPKELIDLWERTQDPLLEAYR
jgi:hypothetical protein